MSKSAATPKTLAARVHPFANNAQKETLNTYTHALQAMQTGKYEDAISQFRSINDACPPEIEERARVYIQACERMLKQRVELHFETSFEQYDYAIGLINNGDYAEAREQLEDLLTHQPKADYAHYGLAMLNGVTGQVDGCLEHLGRAIELNAHNRVQARSDVDFRQMADDPRFTELLYPEAM